MVYVLARSEIQHEPERATLPPRSEELLPEGRVFAGQTILLCTNTIKQRLSVWWHYELQVYSFNSSYVRLLCQFGFFINISFALPIFKT